MNVTFLKRSARKRIKTVLIRQVVTSVYVQKDLKIRMEHVFKLLNQASSYSGTIKKKRDILYQQLKVLFKSKGLVTCKSLCIISHLHTALVCISCL